MNTTSGSAGCAREIQDLHGVWQSPEVFLPVYADWETVTYLAALARKAAGTSPTVAVLPVYAEEPIHFRVGNFVFLSTGLVAGATSEAGLIEVIQTEMKMKVRRSKGRAPYSMPACATMSLFDRADFHDMRQRLEVQVAEYALSTVQHLKRRPDVAQITINR